MALTLAGLKCWRHKYLLFVVFASLIDISCGWNLENLKLKRNDYRIIHVSVFYVRAFLCIEPVAHHRKTSTISGRQPIRCKWNIIILIIYHWFTIWDYFPIVPTLIETGWPENMLPIQPHVYPDTLAHAKHILACNSIIQAIGSSVDMSNGDLWVLDQGSAYCAPKIIAFDLIGLNDEVCLKFMG